MTDMELIAMAQEAGFYAAVISTKDIPVNGEFRKFCENNLCGNYNANYSCPPGCGSVEEVHQRLMDEQKALVLQVIHETGYNGNKAAIVELRKELNTAILRLTEKLRRSGLQGFCLGYGGCPLCEPCRQQEGETCAFPEKRISCMSAYCIDVSKLAEKCGLEFAWIPEKLFLFGMIAFHEVG